MHRFAGRLVGLAIHCAALMHIAHPANAGPASDVIAKLNTVFIDDMQNAKAIGSWKAIGNWKSAGQGRGRNPTRNGGWVPA